MAKHHPKKKKNESTKDGPVDSANDDSTSEQPSDSQTPPTESDLPPTEPVQNEYEKSRTTKLSDKLFWIRIGFAVLGGIAATFLFDSFEDMEEKRWTSIAFMIVLFFVTTLIGKGMKIGYTKSDRKKIVTNGMMGYVFMYLFMWILSHTLVNMASNSGKIPFT